MIFRAMADKAALDNPDLSIDFVGVNVYKFKSDHQPLLWAYEFDPEARMLLPLGDHENFDSNLMR
jgi:hypothetical protein